VQDMEEKQAASNAAEDVSHTRIMELQVRHSLPTLISPCTL